MVKKRTYNDACGVSRALDLVGERWALLIVRELLLGPKRFTDIRESLPGLSADILSQRLRELEQGGIVERATLPPPAPAKVYELTPKGRALEATLIALGRWGGANAEPPGEDMCMSIEAHVVSLRTLFEPDLARDLRATFALHLSGQHFHALVREGEIVVGRGDPPSPDVVIEGEAGTLLGVCHGRIDRDEALRSGQLKIEGDEETALRFLGLFPLPAPVAA